MTFVCEIVVMIELKYSMIMDFPLLCHKFNTKLQEILKGDSPPELPLSTASVNKIYEWSVISFETSMANDKWSS